MDIDVLREKWVEQDRKLDESIHMNGRLLTMANMNRTQPPLRRFALLAGLGTLLGLMFLIILGGFIYKHWAEPRFALPAIALHVWVIAYVVTSIRQMVAAFQIHFDQPVTAVQKQIESLRMMRLRVLRWALLTGQLVWWIPLLIVALKEFWDVDAYRILGPGFLIANLGFGVVIIPAAVWASNKFGERMGRRPAMQRLMRELAGYNLRAASRYLATLDEFEYETRA